MPRYIALLRGINVTGKNKVPMADLRDLAEGLGLRGVMTYIQSGNLLFEATGKATDHERRIEVAITKKFRLTIPVVVRSQSQWNTYVSNNPFVEASAVRPNLVHLALSKERPKQGCVEALEERARNGESIVQLGAALFVDYPQGAGKSKLTPAMFDRLVGSPVTARNWRTVQKLQSML